MQFMAVAVSRRVSGLHTVHQHVRQRTGDRDARSEDNGGGDDDRRDTAEAAVAEKELEVPNKILHYYKRLARST